MVIKNVNLETVCGITSKLPENNMPEIAFAGKSNVGKSSLINALMNRKSYARISATPGKTQTINFYNINEELYLVDLPGYGYSKAKHIKMLKEGLELRPGTTVIPFSSVTKQGREEIWELVETQYLAET